LIVPAILTLAALAVLVSLGNWQLHRLAWKKDLIARVAERPSMPPVDLRTESMIDTGDPDSFLEFDEYRPALVRGEYDPNGEVLVFTSLNEPRGPFGGPGYWVMTPFLASRDGVMVLVNRGFVPDGRQNDYAPAPAGERTIRGLIRGPERGSWLTPAPDLEKRIFFVRDPTAIEDATDLGASLPRVPGVSFFMHFFIDLDASETPPGGLPQAGETRMSFTNNHLQYAITWYGLAAALLAVFVVYVRARLRERDKKPA
jgi:surfeit locus 1 family protein